jgi:hypothetical protein
VIGLSRTPGKRDKLRARRSADDRQRHGPDGTAKHGRDGLEEVTQTRKVRRLHARQSEEEPGLMAVLVVLLASLVLFGGLGALGVGALLHRGTWSPGP